MYNGMLLSASYDLLFPLLCKQKIVVFMFSEDIVDGKKVISSDNQKF